MSKEPSQPQGYDSNPMQMFIAPLNFEAAIVAGQRSFKIAAATHTNMVRRMASMNKEVFDFVDRRLAKDRETAKNFARCQTPQDVVEVYAKFAETTMTDYSEELGVMSNAIAEQTQALTEDFQKQVKEDT